MSILELDDVEVTYERRDRTRFRAVAGASVTVGRGEIVGLVGESGCGKSSLARVAAKRSSLGALMMPFRT